MGEIITIVSGKGGVGKTTLCANIAISLSLSRYNVIAIDSDLGLKNLDILLNLENNSIFDLSDVLANRCTVKKAIVPHDKLPNLHFIPSSQSSDPSEIDKEQMKNLCRFLKEHYDYVLIDAPAGVGTGFLNAIYSADTCLVVATPDLTSIRDADKTARILAENKKNRSYLVINKVRSSLMKKGLVQNIDQIIDSVSLPLLGIVPDDENVIIYSNQRSGIFAKTSSPAATAINNIAKRLTGQDITLYRFWK